jgi:hypothetical protein
MVIMKSKNKGKQLLFDRLAAKGVERDMIPSYIRSMRICYASDHQMPSRKTNRQMQSLGWNNIELDYPILKQSITYFKTEIKHSSTQLKEIKGLNEGYHRQ